MEVTVELEDDLFFADLSKQISLLIMDEDEQEPLPCCPVDSLQSFPGSIYHGPESGFLYEQALRRQISKGTGVFIPQSTQPRKKHKKGRSRPNSKHQKQSQDTKMVSQVPNKTSSKPKKG